MTWLRDVFASDYSIVAGIGLVLMGSAIWVMVQPWRDRRAR